MSIIKMIKGPNVWTPKRYAKEITKKGTAENWAKACVKTIKILLQTVQSRCKDTTNIDEVCKAVHEIHLEYMQIMEIVNKSPKAQKFGVLKPSGFWSYLQKNLPTVYNYYNEWHRRKSGRKLTKTEFKDKYKTGPNPTIKRIKEDPKGIAAAWVKSDFMKKKPEFLADLLAVCEEGDKVHIEEFKKLLK